MPVGESRCKCAATCNLGYCGSINCDSTSCGGGRQKMCENAGIDVQKGGQWLIFLYFFSLLVSGFLFRFYGMIAKQESVGYCSFPKFYFV